jgi:hypothetical protein
VSKDKESIIRIINDIQSGLVELFDLFRELREVLSKSDLTDNPSASSDSIRDLFTEVERPTYEGTTTKDVVTESFASTESPSTPKDTASTDPLTSEGEPTIEEKSGSMGARVSRVLDPIAHELQTSEASAEVIAEFLQAAKNDLITKESPNEKVAADMDVVLKFLRARGKKAIRAEERENIQKRIRRWKAYLSM